jgi:DNA helicase IV
MGLARRRHFQTQGRRVLSFEDEIFGEGGDALGSGLAGEKALLAALDSARTGRMRDIVATIQREQDEIIRAPLAGTLIVQGGPGTGKTAVALHRAAYLLYTHRFPLETQGVLVIGPNRVFLRYIEHVLPSLGETGVVLSTIEGLVDKTDLQAVVPERGAVARLKGDARMAKVVARAVTDRQRQLREPLEVPFGSFVLRIPAGLTRDVVSHARRRPGTHNARRRGVEQSFFRVIYDRYVSSYNTSRGRGSLTASDSGADGPLPFDDVVAVLRRELVVLKALDRMWPVLTPAELINDAFGAMALLKSACRGVLADDEAALLHRHREASPDDVTWTTADLPLLDEAASLLGTKRAKDKEVDEKDLMRTFGHIVVDEAQDLSPMQLRMLRRRSLAGSMTIVGDLAQATGASAPESWDAVLTELRTRVPKPERVAHLSVGYRTPSEVMELAGRVLALAAPGLSIPQSVRTTGVLPTMGRVVDISSSLLATIAEIRADIPDAQVAVLAAESQTDDLLKVLVNAGVEAVDAAGGMDDPVIVVPATLAKGLEFDAVVVVEPSRIVDESDQGMRTLFVALTRATRRLVILHANELPPGLAGAESFTQPLS